MQPHACAWSLYSTPPTVHENVWRFILFRVLFNCRFYYPVYAILFMDFGLSVREFAILNAAWAVTIVVLEVPSGAVADIVGRRALVILSAILMCLELLVLLWTPVGGGAVVFWAFLLNRILGGMSEAASSGADEALAYDSLPKDGRDEAWARVQSRLLRVQPLGFMITGLLGALVYDGEQLGKLLGMAGINLKIPQEVAMKLPLVLTLGLALAAAVVAVGMKESQGTKNTRHALSFRATCGDAFRRMLEAGIWIWRSAWPMILILTGLVFDSMVRLYYTVAASYYRLLEIPEAYFGVIGVASLGVAFSTSWIVERMVKVNRPRVNFAIVALLTLAGVTSLAFPIPYWGFVFVLPLVLAIRMAHFFISSYLNSVTDSKNRATVLSFRGLALNAGYGLVTLLYGLQSWWIARRGGFDTTKSTENAEVFAESLTWWPGYFLVTLVLLGIAAFCLQRRKQS